MSNWTWTAEKIQNEIDILNEKLGLHVECEINVREQSKFPLSNEGKTIVFIPQFFNDPALSDEIRKMLVVWVYSLKYLIKPGRVYIATWPEVFVKHICDTLDISYISEYELEEAIRPVRRKYFKDEENSCFYEIGDVIRVEQGRRYKVVDIKYESAEKINITVRGGAGKLVFEEKELFDLHYENLHIPTGEIHMRRNIFILSGPSCSQKTSLIELLKGQMDNIRFINEPLYDAEYVSNVQKEIEATQKGKKIVLVMNGDASDHINRQYSIIRRYPLIRSIFVTSAFDRTVEGEFYDYIVDINLETCAEQIMEILDNTR